MALSCAGVGESARTSNRVLPNDSRWSIARISNGWLTEGGARYSLMTLTLPQPVRFGSPVAGLDRNRERLCAGEAKVPGSGEAAGDLVRSAGGDGEGGGVQDAVGLE